MARTPSTMLPLGTSAPDFDLTDSVTGQQVRLADFVGQPALLVVFMCNHCPYVVLIRERLRDLVKSYQARGLAMVGISANDADAYPADSPENMAQEARNLGYTFPYLHDDSQRVAKAYQAACTPDFFLFDKQRRLVYRGQFDDARPGNGRPVTGADLEAAIGAVLGGTAPDPDQRPSLGCNIKWKPGNQPDYGHH
jgi:peroxiredoxin